MTADLQEQTSLPKQLQRGHSDPDSACAQRATQARTGKWKDVRCWASLEAKERGCFKRGSVNSYRTAHPIRVRRPMGGNDVTGGLNVIRDATPTTEE